MNKTAKHLSIAAAALALLSGCGGDAKETLGLTRSAPDEFAVVKRAPLEMPPDYTLRPPMPGVQRPQEMQPDNQARQAVFGEKTGAADKKAGSGEAFLLQQTGGAAADPSIRNVVDQESTKAGVSKKPVAERLLGWTRGGNEPAATVVDPAAEAERLRQNQEQGKPVTAGDTPTREE